MQLLLFDWLWMSFNIFLALTALAFGWLMNKAKNKILKVIFIFFWLIFLPNTIYLVTDITHFFEDWNKIAVAYRGFLLLTYFILIVQGIMLYGFAIKQLEKLIQKNKKIKNFKLNIIILLNFILGFGITLGRIERTNSWEIITNIPKVISDSYKIFNDPFQVLVVIFFGVLSNLVYFGLKKYFKDIF